ncbi:hypothetical protein XENOCAPTIV_000599 [Xenoophorus captivus]|uniref:Regulator of G protein signalling-like domain-containing protein n=1 Tax=Xenoophorus captivus TaxID=1517983 RepID=A0ABV0QFM8_9TELE
MHETDRTHTPKADNSTDLSWSSTPDSLSPTTFSSPSSSRVISQIIGAEDDYFDRDQEQVGFSYPDVNMSFKHNFCRPTHPYVFQTNGLCDSFNSIAQLKSRPAHLAAFLHHVISQFEPAPVVRLS